METATQYQAGQNIKVRDKWTPNKSRRQATVIEDQGVNVLCLVHHRASRGDGWFSRREVVARWRII